MCTRINNVNWWVLQYLTKVIVDKRLRSHRKQNLHAATYTYIVIFFYEIFISRQKIILLNFTFRNKYMKFPSAVFLNFVSFTVYVVFR